MLVGEHLGTENVRAYGTYGSEPDSVDVMVRLEGASRRDMFSVSVYGPDHSEARGLGGGPGGGCRTMERQPSTQCVELAGGGLATVSSVPYGFSDNNRNGSVLMASAYTPPKGMAIAMYESYTSSVPVDEGDLLDLMSDARLAWETDAELVEAGRDVVVRRLAGLTYAWSGEAVRPRPLVGRGLAGARRSRYASRDFAGSVAPLLDLAPAPSPRKLGLGALTHFVILVTRPAPTVRPPSRIANRRPSSMAIGWMSSTDISVLSPGMTISVPSGRVTTPVTSVVRK